jgi:hypothetical protein
VSYLPVNNRTTDDEYTDACTLRCPGAVRCNLLIANAAVYRRFGYGGGGIDWQDEVFTPPGFMSLDRRFDAIQLRSAAAGHPAQVTIEAVPPAELGAPIDLLPHA